jgi:hypothetical protein
LERQSHVDGDFLRILVERQALRYLLDMAEDMDLFKECLHELDGGAWTKGFDEDGDQDAKYMGLAYEVLGYYLRPVF